jgi:hypothetical protein
VTSAATQAKHSPIHRATAAAVLLVALGLVTAACGGGNDARAETTATPSSTPTESPTVVATPTPSATPLSPFEDQPPVKAARQFFELLAQAVNHQERSLASVSAATTTQGLKNAKFFAHGDLAKGYTLPGPEPFTPLNVQTTGGVAKVNTCFLFSGWSVDPRTGKVVGKRDVSPAVIVMRKVGGAWKFDDYYDGTGDCHGVRVDEVRW